MSSLNSTHTIQIKQENRGVRFLVGLVSAVVLIRWWITGSLLAAVTFAVNREPPSGMGSVSGVLIPIIFDIVIAFGGIVIAVGSGAWFVIWDLIQGSIEAIRIWRGKKAAIATATETALQAAGVAAGAVAGVESAKAVANAVQEPRPISPAKLERALRMLADRIEQEKARVDAMEKRIDQDLMSLASKFNDNAEPAEATPSRATSRTVRKGASK